MAAGEALLAPEITRRMIEEYVRRPRPGDGRPRGLETLTSRELEVLGLIARGRSNAEIAAALFLSELADPAALRAARRFAGVIAGLGGGAAATREVAGLARSRAQVGPDQCW